MFISYKEHFKFILAVLFSPSVWGSGVWISLSNVIIATLSPKVRPPTGNRQIIFRKLQGQDVFGPHWLLPREACFGSHFSIGLLFNHQKL